MHIVLSERGDVRTVTVPFIGNYVREVAAEPARFFLWPSRESRRRQIRLRHFSQEALSITRAKGMAAWLVVRSHSNGKTAKPLVEFDVLPGHRPGDESTIAIEYLTAGGEGRSVAVPVKIGGDPKE